MPVPANGASGPIFEDDSDFEFAFKVFHGKDGIIPLSDKDSETTKVEPIPQFNPLAENLATVSLSAFGPGGPFSFEAFSGRPKTHNHKSESSKKESSHKEDSSTHEALGNEWLEKGNCPIAKSYRAVNGALPFLASTLKPPRGLKLKCPRAVVAARAALARTALVKSLRPQPLPEKMLVIGLLGMAANVPLGIWRERVKKFSLSWFIAIHTAVPFIAMLRKSVLMPKTAMVFTIAASILGQVIGSRAERFRLMARAQIERERMVAQVVSIGSVGHDDRTDVNGLSKGRCNTDGAMWNQFPRKGLKYESSPSSSAGVCF
ncbi:hypothetical protein Tco_0996723 [Tanacetum coccineum]